MSNHAEKVVISAEVQSGLFSSLSVPFCLCLAVRGCCGRLGPLRAVFGGFGNLVFIFPPQIFHFLGYEFRMGNHAKKVVISAEIQSGSFSSLSVPVCLCLAVRGCCARLGPLRLVEGGFENFFYFLCLRFSIFWGTNSAGVTMQRNLSFRPKLSRGPFCHFRSLYVSVLLSKDAVPGWGRCGWLRAVSAIFFIFSA